MSSTIAPRQFLTDSQRAFINKTFQTEPVGFFDAMYVLVGPDYTEEQIRSVAVMVRLILRSSEHTEVKQAMFDLISVHSQPEDLPTITERARSLFSQ